VILVPGDIAGHNVSRSLGETSSSYDYKYENMLDTLTSVAHSIQQYFPNTLILPTIGNNDTEFHYQSPDFGINKKSYYDAFFGSWFTDHQVNNQIANIREIERTFKNGGYYRVDVSDQISIISLSSNCYSFKSEIQDDVGQLKWLED